MLNVIDAVRKAREYFSALHEDEVVTELHTAEVERSSDGSRWAVTLSYGDDDVSAISKHKVVEVDAETGDFVSMKLRTL
ncbi:MAG: hypothetical protein AAGD01_09735 [Acidobacteriota bacterium]